MVRLTDRPDMTLDVYRGRKTTIQQQQHIMMFKSNLSVQDSQSATNENGCYILTNPMNMKFGPGSWASVS